MAVPDRLRVDLNALNAAERRRLRRRAGRHLRALAVDRRARLAARPFRHPGATAPGAWYRRCAPPARRSAGADPRPPRARRQGDGRRRPDRRLHRRAVACRPHRHCSAEEFARLQQLNAAYNAAASASRSSWPCAARAAVAWPQRRSSPPSSAGSRSPPTVEQRRVPAPDPPHRRDPPRRAFGEHTPLLGRPGLGLGRGAGRAQRPRLRRTRRAHRHLPQPGSPGLRRATGALDARGVRLRRGAHRRRGQRRRRLSRRRLRTRRACSPAATTTPCATPAEYDGRLGILVPMACVRALHARRPAPDLRHRGGSLRRGGRPALQGHLPRLGRARPAPSIPPGSTSATRRRDDARGHARRRPAAGRHPGARARPGALPRLRRSAHRAGPGAHRTRPAARRGDGSINGGVRWWRGDRPREPRRHHADGPAPRRRRCGRPSWCSISSARGLGCPTSSGTVGMLEVPGGSINVVPGRCRFSLDIRATTDAVRDACVADVLAELAAICARRGVRHHARGDDARRRRALRPLWQAALGARGRSALGLPLHRMPSGAGHDAMKLHA
jgi:hypothetical protein